jgi:arginase
MQNTSVVLISAPLDLGAESLGVDIGPVAFQERGITTTLSHAGFKVEDAGTVSCTKRENLQAGDPSIPYAEEIVRVNEEIAAMTEKAVSEGKRVLVLGGDHSVDLGAFAGAAAAGDGPLGMIYIDAHGDMNTPETSVSHNIHGMHLAALMGWGAPQLVNAYRPGAKLDKTNLLHIGASDLDPGEIDLITREQLNCFSIFDLLKYGLAPLIEKIDALQQKTGKVWVSLDLDAIDTTYAPGVGIPSRGGFTYREIAAITDYIGKHCNVIGLDVVEYNPNHDVEHKTADLGIELAAKLLGSNYSWYTTYMDRNTGGAYMQESAGL